jgi:hypothetical protein
VVVSEGKSGVPDMISEQDYERLAKIRTYWSTRNMNQPEPDQSFLLRVLDDVLQSSENTLIRGDQLASTMTIREKMALDILCAQMGYRVVIDEDITRTMNYVDDLLKALERDHERNPH